MNQVPVTVIPVPHCPLSNQTAYPSPSGYTTQSCPYSTPLSLVPFLLSERLGILPYCFLFLFFLPYLVSFAKLINFPYRAKVSSPLIEIIAKIIIKHF